MIPTLHQFHTRPLAFVVLALLMFSAACSPKPAVIRPTPTFILDNLPLQGQPGPTPVPGGGSGNQYLPVVSGENEAQNNPAASSTTPASGPSNSSESTVTPQPTGISPSGSSTPTRTPTPTSNPESTQAPTPTRVVIEPNAIQMRFAVIGDYGTGGANAESVASMVLSWEPDIIITTGDNNLPSGSSDTIDNAVGRLYHTYINPYTGQYGDQADRNRFFPALGAHDWITDNARPYLDFFNLPGNERYYEFSYGPAAFFAVDSDAHEPNGVYSDTPQAEWLRSAVTRSTECWQFAYFFNPPYSSGQDGSSVWMQWPFDDWGVDAVFSGHDRHYERLEIGNVLYFVNGLGGNTITPFSAVQPGSLVRFNEDHGAMLVTVDQTTAVFEFYDLDLDLIDYRVIDGGCL